MNCKECEHRLVCKYIDSAYKEIECPFIDKDNKTKVKKSLLSDKETKVLNVIIDFIDKNGYSPTTREICMNAGLNSLSNAWNCLRNLERKGYITTTCGKARSIRVVKD